MATERPLSALQLNLNFNLNQSSTSAKPLGSGGAETDTSPSSRDELLSISTTSIDDAFPDFEDPNLFSTSSADVGIIRNGVGMQTGLGVSAEVSNGGGQDLVSPSSSNDSDSPISISQIRDRVTLYDLQRASFTAPSTTSVSSSASVPFSTPTSTPASTTSASTTASHRFLLPLPISSPEGNTSQASFAMSEIGDDEGGMEGFLAPEIAGADISISADGSFVETTSGPAARELKRRYDKLVGVNKDVRSPFVIISMINQHGKQVYRVMTRVRAEAQAKFNDLPELDSAAAGPSTASGSGIGNGTVNSTGSQSQRKRRSRISVGGLFQPTGRKAAGSLSGAGSSVGNVQGPASGSVFGGGVAHVDNHTHGRNKLRKPRSIPDLASAYASSSSAQDQTFPTYGSTANTGSTVYSVSSASASGAVSTASMSQNQNTSPTNRTWHGHGHGPTGRTHSHSVTGADMSRLRGLPTSAFGNMNVPTVSTSNSQDTSFGSSVGHVKKLSGDVFGSVMGWRAKGEAATSLVSLSASSGVGSSTSARGSPDVPRCERHGKADIRHPFGRGVVTFDSPARGSAVWLPAVASSPKYDNGIPSGGDNDADGDTMHMGQIVWGRRLGGREIREVQSFESGLTARAVSMRRVKRVESRESGSGEGTDGSGVNGKGEDGRSKMLRHDSIDSLASAASALSGKNDQDAPVIPASPSTSYAPTSPFSPLSPVTSTSARPPRAVPSPETSLHTRYSTSVFDVIQNYRGLPMLDLLDDAQASVARQPTIKMSLSALDGAVPRDDPRFVIWGEVRVGMEGGEEEEDVGGGEKARERAGSGVESERDKDRASASSMRPSRATHANNLTRAKRNSHGKSGVMSTAPSPPKLRIQGISDEGDGADDGYADGSVSPSVSSSLSLSQDGSEGRTGSTVRVMMAATIERWIAQLTSQLDYDELLIFFLTYRTYISSLDLCHLLICRFHWALEEPVSGAAGSVMGGDAAHEIVVKQIVRLRTFVAIRYWLLTFFRVDFLPNRELCLLFANWLNTLWRDPILDRYRDAKNIVRKLKKIAKECREAHSRRKRSTSTDSSNKKGKVFQSLDRILGDLSNGVSFAATLRKMSAAQDDEDSDVDLDFNPDESLSYFDALGYQGFASFANQLDAASNNTGSGHPNGSSYSVISGHSASSPTRPTPSASHIMLQQPLHLTILQHARAAPPGANLPLVDSRGTLPVHHSAFSRVVVNTIGRLGRWKRVLSQRSPAVPLSPCGDINAFDLELNATGDLLTVKGGVEQYLKMIDPAASSGSLPLQVPEDVVLDIRAPSRSDTEEDTSPKTPTPPVSAGFDDADSGVVHVVPASPGAGSEPDTLAISDRLTPAKNLRVTSLASKSLRTNSTDSMRSLDVPSARVIPNPAYSTQAWHPDVVSIDDLDLSDSSDGDGDAMRAPPGLRPTRRLPLRREFEFVRRSMDSVSSLGIISRPSVALSENLDSTRSSVSSPRGLGNAVQPWQVNALIDDLSDDGDDPGDADAALRRLEGQINGQQQRHKEAKVDGWVRTIQERMAAGDFGNEALRNQSDDDDADSKLGSQIMEDASGADSEYVNGSASRTSEESSRLASITMPGPLVSTTSAGEASTPTLHQAPQLTTSTPAAHPFPSAADAKPNITDAVPAEILESRIPAASSTAPHPTARSPPFASGNKTVHTPPPLHHRSFILNYRSEILARHFAVIEREIFLGIKFEELVSDEWMTSDERLNVLDWAQFLRDRRRAAEKNGKGKISVLAAARARFNLVANFVISEIILTHPHDRTVVVSKFIRIAWKAYTQNNFSTLVAIITGLSSDWVKKVMRRSWSRVGIWENRVFEDLKAFATSENDFRYIRKAVAAIADAKPLGSGNQDDSTGSTSHTDGISSGPKNKSHADGKQAVPISCVPFIGAYLSQLYTFSQLPDLIDPSAPTESVDIDPSTGNYMAPSHSEVFSTLRPLPSSMQLEPLVNVHKQRKIAGVIKSLVAGQHLANKVAVEIDKKLLSKCLKLRALDHESLQRISALYSDH